MGYVSDAQRKAVHASKADGGKGNPNKMLKKISPALAKISASCKAQAKKKFKVWPSAYASSWLVKEYKRRGGKYSGSTANKVSKKA